jgi:hypothetical protein
MEDFHVESYDFVNKNHNFIQSDYHLRIEYFLNLSMSQNPKGCLHPWLGTTGNIRETRMFNGIVYLSDR